MAARHYATIRFYEELNDFLPPVKRRQDQRVGFPERRAVKDLIESLGVPHTEVDLILVNGESVGFAHLVSDGDRISVYPKFETFDITTVSALQRPPLREVRFVADVHLGKLARRLRLLGFDCLFNIDWHDPELAQCSATEQRVLLTRDLGLLKRAQVTHGIYIRSDQADQQTRQVLDRLDLHAAVQPFTRCIHCNGELAPVSCKQHIRDRVPPFTFRSHNRFYTCHCCGKVYWRGTHWQRLASVVHAVVDSGRRRGKPSSDNEQGEPEA